MSLEVKNLTKKFGDQIAVNNVSFSCKKGSITGFLGPNGAGKSTTMKMIMGFLRKNDGEVFINGEKIEDGNITYRRNIGYLPEHNPLYLEMYVKEFLSFIADIYGIGDKKERVEELIQMTGLSQEQHKRITQLSKGYRQRVGLAQAMMQNPDVLILDEPSSGLDPNQLVEIRSLIQQLGKEKTVIFSTHIMQEVQALCDRVIIIDQGNIVVNDEIENLSNYIDKEQSYRVEFEKSIDIGKLRNQVYISSIKEIDSAAYLIRAKDQNDIRAELFDYAVKTNNRIIEARKENSSVEDIFQQLTKKR